MFTALLSVVVGVMMIEFAWSGGELFFRERSFQVDASGAFCGVTDFGDWKKVPALNDFPPQELRDTVDG